MKFKILRARDFFIGCLLLFVLLIPANNLYAGLNSSLLGGSEKADVPPVENVTPTVKSLPPLPVVPIIASGPRMPYFADFDGFDQDRPCDRTAWTMQGVPWKVSQDDIDKAAADSQETNPEPAFDKICFNLRTYNKLVQTSMEIIRGIYGELSKDESRKYALLWAPFFDFPNIEANEYFHKCTPLLVEYLNISTQIDKRYQLYQKAYEEAALSAGLEDETGCRTAMEVMYSYASQLKELQADMAVLIKKLQELGDPPNPLQAKCKARKRHTPAKSGNLLRISWDGWETDYLEKSDLKTYLVAIYRDNGDVAWKINKYWDPGKGRVRTNVFHAFLDASEKDWLALEPGSNDPNSGKVQFMGAGIGNWGVLIHPKDEFHNFKDYVTEPESKLLATATIGVNAYPAKVCAMQLSQPSGYKYVCFNYCVDFGDENYCVVFRSSFHGPRDSELSDFLTPNENMTWAKANYLRFLQRVKFEWVDKVPAGEEDFAYCDPNSDTPKMVPPSQSDNSQKKVDSGQKALENKAKADELKESLAVSDAVINQYEKAIARVEAELQGVNASDEAQKSRVEALKREITGYQDSIEAEKFYVKTLQTGKTHYERPAFAERSSEKITEQIKAELSEYDEDWKIIKNLPKYYNMLDDNAYKDRWQQLHAAITDPDAHQKLKSLSGEVRKDLSAQQNNVLEKEKGKVCRAEWEYIGVVAIEKSTQFVLVVASLANPAVGHVVLGQGIAHGGLVECSPFKALENGLRGYSNKIDIAWATVAGAFETEIVKDKNGKNVERPKGFKGAAEGFVFSYLTNTIMDYLGESVQAKFKKQVPKIPNSSNKKAVEFAEFKSSKERFDADLLSAKSIEASIPKNADGSHNNAHPDYAKSKNNYDSALNEVNSKHEIESKREDLHQELAEHIKNAEKTIPTEARNADGSIDKDSPEFQKIQAEMNAIREKFKPINQKRMKFVNEALDASNMTKEHFTGGEPENVTSDIDITPQSMEQGQKFVDSLKTENGSPNVVELQDRWVITDYDTTVWKHNSIKAKVGSSEQSAEVELAFQYGSDKFGTYRNDKAGQQDPFGNTMDNAKKMVDAFSEPGGPNLHVIGKSVNKAVQNSPQTSEIGVDVVFLAKTTALRNHKTPEEAGIVNFGDSPAVKKAKIEKFIQESKNVMNKSLKQRKIDSDKMLQVRKERLDWLLANGKTNDANALRADMAITRSINKAAFDALSVRAPQLLNGVFDVPEATSSGRYGYSWLVEDMLSGSEKEPEPSTPAMADLAKEFKAAKEKIEDNILLGLDPKSRDYKHYLNLKLAAEEGMANPIKGVQKMRMLTGHPIGVVLKGIRER